MADRLRLDVPPRDIAIVMLSALGDAVHVLPVVSALERAWPHARITWVIQPVPHRLALHHPGVDEFIVFHRKRGTDAWRSHGIENLLMRKYHSGWPPHSTSRSSR